MFNYHMAPLEDYVNKLYHRLGIMELYQLDMMDIAEKLNVWIHFMDMESQAIDRNGLYSIVIDRRLPSAEQWQDFGHELCHVLRQAGKQTDMPMDFLMFQETKAESFMYEFCVPTFMLINCSLPQQRGEAVQFVSETFNVTKSFADKRLSQIERRMFNNHLNNQFAAAVEAEREYKRSINCDYVLESRQGKALYNHHSGLIGFIKNKEAY
jgi:Zn-dependent peptidase ImmA (M78 family)